MSVGVKFAAAIFCWEKSMGFGGLMDGIVSRYYQHQQFKAYELKMCRICARNLGIELFGIRAKSESVGVQLLEVDSLSKRYDISFFQVYVGK